jgi:dipeptidyl aminopeptidase/acylaminoacyl peptidase
MALAAAYPATAPKHPVSVDEVMSMQQVGRAAISPDGSKVLYTVSGWEWPSGKAEPDKGDKPPEMRSHVWLVEADGSAPARQLTSGDKGESQPEWSPDGKSVSFLSGRSVGAPATDAKAQVWILPMDGGDARKLTDAKEGVSQYKWSEDGKKIAFLSRNSLSKEEEDRHKRKDDARVFEADFQQTHLWVIDVASGKAAQITNGEEFGLQSFSWSPDGKKIAYAAKPTPLVRDYRSDVAIVDVETHRSEKIAATISDETAPAWSPDGQTIAFVLTHAEPSPNADGVPLQSLTNGHLVLYDVASKKTRDVTTRSFDYSVSQAMWSPDSKRIYMGIGDRAWHDVFAYDMASREFVQITRKKTITAGSFSKDGSRTAFTMDSDMAPGEVYVSGRDFTSPRKLTTTHPQVAEIALGESEVITWKSPDGNEVEGILLKPAGYEPGHKYPMVVEVHGGPTGAHSDRFNLNGQYWAGRGWAVLYPNPRGSTNYGEKFTMANTEDWGGGDYRDIMSGVDAMVARGIADPDRLAVMGWSYGGYMTCWIVSQTGRFKAAMMGAGLSDLPSMYGTTDIPNYLGTFFRGRPSKENMALYAERSGITYVDRVTTPVLILHGGSDERVPVGQPMEFYRALKDRGKTASLVFYPREGHGLSEYYHQRDRLKRQYEWIAKYTLGTN